VEHVNELTQTAASSAEEMSGATEELSRMAQELQRLVGQFKITARDGAQSRRVTLTPALADATGAASQADASTGGVSLANALADKRIRFITHEDQKILYVDFSHGSLHDMHVLITESVKVIRSQPVKSLLLLTNVEKQAFNPSAAAEMQRYAQENEPFVFAAAVVGLDGLKRIVYETIRKASGQNMMAFSGIEEAKQWLVERKKEIAMA
jgi:hypothetical protein